MSSKENTLSAKTSSQSRQNIEQQQQREEAAKKRASSVEETKLRNSQQHLRESINAINFPYPVSFEECRGIDDVLISPPYMEFEDGSEGKVMQQTLTIRNLGAKAAVVRLRKPNSMIFQLRAEAKDGHKLYPGLSLKALVIYSFQQASSLHAMIPIEINGTVLDYHLICTFSSAHLVAEPSVLDFGSVNLDSVSDVKILTVVNTGGKAGRFSVDAGKNHHMINIRPERGLVKSNQTIRLKVQLSGKREGMLNGSLWIKSNPNICITVIANVIKPNLLVECPTKIHQSVLILFPATYLETRRYRSLKLKNHSAQATSFVLLIKDCKHFQSVSEMDLTKNPSLGVFKIKPSEGRLQPFEEATLTISFCPTFQKLELLRKVQRDRSIDHFVAVMKICKIQVAEAKSVLKTESSSSKKVEQNIPQICAPGQSRIEKELSFDDEAEGTSVTVLYLHGSVEVPCLKFQPEKLQLNDLNVDDRVERSICITNPSEDLPLKFTFITQPWVHCRPCQAFLKPKQSVQVAIAIRAQFNLEAVFYLEFELWASSLNEQPASTSLVRVSRLSLECTYNPLTAPAALASSRTLCKVASLKKLPPERDYSLTYSPSQLQLKIKQREYWARYLRRVLSARDRDSGCSKQDLWLCSSNASSDARYCGDRLIAKPRDKRQSSTRPDIPAIAEQVRNEALPSLTALQLFKVQVSPLKLDFGKMARQSERRCQLSFQNNNDFEVAVRLTSFSESNVTFANDGAFVLEPRSILSCCVRFQAKEHFGKFSSYVNYALDGGREYQLPLTASVVFKALKLTTHELTFERDCHPLEGQRLSFKPLQIENELNADTTFKWIVPEKSSFQIEPRRGCVPAGGRLYASVRHEPDASSSNRLEATLQDEDGSCASLRLEAPLRAPRASLIGDNADLGRIPLNVARHVHALLYNAEYFAVFFQIEQRTLIRGIDVSPSRGCLKPRGVVALTARLLFGACLEGSAQIDVTLQRRLTLHWNIKFTVVLPRIKFEPSVVEWARVCVNSYRVQEVRASNLSDAELVLKFPLESYEEFRVSSDESKKRPPISAGHEQFQIAPRSSTRLFLHFEPCDLARYELRLPLVINDLSRTPAEPSSDDLEAGRLLSSDDEYYANLKGFSLLALPPKIASIYLSSTVTQPSVIFNKLSFRFSDSFVQDSWHCCNNCADCTVALILHTETYSESINFPFVFCWTSGAKSTMSQDRITVCLKPREQVNFRILFKPSESGHFTFELPVHISQQDNEQAYNKLILDGLRSKPSIESDVLEVNFAAVPLHTLSKRKFNLRVSKFARASFLRSEICCPDQCSPECGKLSEVKALSVSFPCGSEIKPHCSHEIQVEIQFSSSVPLSFRTRLTFAEQHNDSSLSISVCATADNSLLSTHNYQNNSCESFLLRKRQSEACSLASSAAASPQNPRKIIWSNVDKRRMLDAASDLDEPSKTKPSDREDCSTVQSATVNHYVSLDATAIRNGRSYSPAVVEALERWLYEEVFTYEFNPKLFDGTSLTLLKSELLDATSKNDKNKELPKLCTYIDVLLRLTDGDVDVARVLQFEEAYPERGRKSSEILVTEALNLYNDILKCMLSKGALVGHFAAEYLFNYEEYKILMKNQRYLLDKDAFEFCSQAAWIDLLLQSYKVYPLAQVNEQSLSKHANLLSRAKSVDSCPNAMYSIDVAKITKRSRRLYCRINGSEAILLAWLEFNNALYFEARIIDEFGECLSDSLAFIAVTLNYCPFLAGFFTLLYNDPRTDDQKIHNAVCLLLAWNKIRLGFTLTPSQIIQANPVQMLMLSRHLFKHLPTYLIRSKVNFTCPLTQSLSAQIRLPIEPNRQISYVVQFIGNDLNAFTCKPLLSIRPNTNPQLKVHFFARKIGKTEVYLILCGSTVGPYFGENLVFLLEGLPDQLQISQTFVFSTKLYQIVKKNLTIDVPYENPKEYDIWISRQQPNTTEPIDQLAMTKWQMTHSSKYTLNRLTIDNAKISIDQDSQTANLTISLACLTCESQDFWIIFRSNSADFIIQIVSNYRISITDNLVIQDTRHPCICPSFPLRIDFECPQIHKLLLPSANVQLQHCILKLFKTSLSTEDYDFWTIYLDNTIGLRFIKWFLQNSSSTDLFNFKQIYNVTTDKNSLLLCNVSDGNESDDIEVMIHICGASVKKTLITLTSYNKKEIRLCQVDVVREESKTESLQSMKRK